MMVILSSFRNSSFSLSSKVKFGCKIVYVTIDYEGQKLILSIEGHRLINVATLPAQRISNNSPLTYSTYCGQSKV